LASQVSYPQLKWATPASGCPPHRMQDVPASLIPGMIAMDRPEDVPLAASLTVELIAFAERPEEFADASVAGGGPFQVNDRVHRLKGEIEATQWGTIVGPQNGDSWLVIDNLGVPHQDRTDDLVAAVRGGVRGRPLPAPNWD
jgi:hypothetical protein